jgi:hypothetical protein
MITGLTIQLLFCQISLDRLCCLPNITANFGISESFCPDVIRESSDSR